jgi:hypothetical protein
VSQPATKTGRGYIWEGGAGLLAVTSQVGQVEEQMPALMFLRPWSQRGMYVQFPTAKEVIQQSRRL